MTWVSWAGFVASCAGWFALGVLFGRRLMRREVDQAIDTANLLRKGLQDTPRGGGCHDVASVDVPALLGAGTRQRPAPP